MIENGGKARTIVINLALFFSFLATLAILHLPYLRLPYFWDELGQFVPASLDLFRDGAWVSTSIPPNVHPPGVMFILASVWNVSGYSILTTRLCMLAVASLGLLFTFRLTVHLAHGKIAPAFAAVLFLVATPLFYTQSMMVTLDLPVMTFTAVTLVLFLEERYIACAMICVGLVLIKETAVTTPIVFAAWLWFARRKRLTSLCFILPVLALGTWLLFLHKATGQWLGNAQFAHENINDALTVRHFLVAIVARTWFLFVADGRFLGTVALYVGRNQLRGNEWRLAGLVAAGQIAIVTIVGNAELDRYLLPALPVLYAAMASAACTYSVLWRWNSQVAMIALMLIGWRWNPPYPFPFEDNLTMMNFVHLQQQAAEYLEVHAPEKQIASVWPFTFAIKHPELGYVQRSLRAVDAPGLRIADLVSLDPKQFDLLVVYKRFSPIKGTWIDVAPLRPVLRKLHHYYDVRVEATDEEIRKTLGFRLLKRWASGDQWLAIYAPEPQ